MDNQLSNTSHISPFEAIRKETEDGVEYWSARDLYKLLGYSSWQKFRYALNQAQKACENSGQAVSDHFNLEVKMIVAGKGAKRKTEDYQLSRYACYLVIQNSDPSKPIVALGQTYFAMQTRRQELTDRQAELPEDQLRLLRRGQMNIYNTKLAETAQGAGVISPLDFAIFQDHGYRGLYGGLGAKDIHQRKDLKKSQHILDHMGSEELADNIFRAAQADAKIKREAIQGKEQANQAHHEVGQEVRETIKRLGGTMPEDLPTPVKSIQQLQREEQLRIERERQPSLFTNMESVEE